MIICYPKGQLGNQIFQYVFLRTIGKDQKIISSGFGKLIEVFEVDNILEIKPGKGLRRYLVKTLFKASLEMLSSVRAISSIEVNMETVLGQFSREKSDYRHLTGLFRNIIYLKNGYFQSEEFFAPEEARALRLRDKFRKQANILLAGCPKDAYLVFVHIRMGDYKNYRVFGKKVQPPVSYYWKQIDYFLKEKPNSFFIFFSDEPEKVEQEFGALKNKIVSHGQHFGTDLAIMTRCRGAILAPSSYGWWGAYLMENRDKVFVPKNWLGFNSGLDYHTKPIPAIFQEVEI